ncbi:uncharacterized protein EI90DRAFT_3016506 [Cantharellus anzutake]|uniref:uncharacterized protein n=1 Tax=Cantharellus anzutake TaxID=1750568 RepID=UPI001906E8E8|nr:uncharacterized protein EI90DRAFT_3016506 [Cantharellus anzutake]KAF8331056.1 hypothetical protein EI90DRAFT_3016506 [Cantharellus anzutake]
MPRKCSDGGWWRGVELQWHWWQYLKFQNSRPVAQRVFEAYVKGCHNKYRLDDYEIQWFRSQGVSKSFILSFHIPYKLKDWVVNGGHIAINTLESLIPEHIFKTEMSHMVQYRLLKPLLEIKSHMWELHDCTSILDRLGLQSIAVVDYEGHKMPVQVIAAKSLEEREEWQALQSAILERFSAPTQETSVPRPGTPAMNNLTHFEMPDPLGMCSPTPTPMLPGSQKKPYKQMPKGKGRISVMPQPGPSWKAPNLIAHPMSEQRPISNTSSLWDGHSIEDELVEKIASHLQSVELDLPISTCAVGPAMTGGPQTSMTAPSTLTLTSSYEAIVEQRSDNEELSEIEMDVIISMGQSKHFSETAYHNMLINHFGCAPTYAALLTHMVMANRRS